MNTQDLQALSEAIDSGIINMTDVLDKVEVRKFAGHEDFATTERYYEFATKSVGERTDAFEAALG